MVFIHGRRAMVQHSRAHGRTGRCWNVRRANINCCSYRRWVPATMRNESNRRLAIHADTGQMGIISVSLGVRRLRPSHHSSQLPVTMIGRVAHKSKKLYPAVGSRITVRASQANTSTSPDIGSASSFGITHSTTRRTTIAEPF